MFRTEKLNYAFLLTMKKRPLFKYSELTSDLFLPMPPQN